jgi:PAS domain S-box-containing protein
MFRVRDFSITKKLTWMNMLVSGAALLLACTAFVTYELVTFRNAIVRILSIQAQIVGFNSVSALLFNDPQSAEHTLSALKAAPNIVSAWIYTPDGRPLAGYWRDRGGQTPPLPAIPPGQTEVHWFKDRQVVLVRSIEFQGKPRGTVYIRSDLQEMNDRLKRYATIVAIVLMTSLTAALLISSRSQRAIAEPILHLAETARIVSREKNYSVRAAPTDNRDELATLIEAFNEMLGRIQERDVALRESEERYRVVAETATDAIITMDEKSTILFVNKAAEKIFGHTPAEMMGQKMTMLMPENLRPVHGAGLERYIRSGERRISWSSVQLPGLHKSGKEVPLEVSFGEYNENGKRGFTGIVRDVTDRKRAEDQIKELNLSLERRVAERTGELEAANKELEAFTYSVSHDLRAPLRHIDGFSKLLVEQHTAALPQEAREYVSLIRESTREMGQLVDDLLNLARVGRKELSLQVTGLNSLVDEVVADLNHEIGGRTIDWKLQKLPFVECDPGLMKQVFVNLLSNAVKFTRPRDRAVIEVGAVERDGQSAIVVRDNGVGFSMKHSDKLFRVFQRLHRQEDFEGTGVGLATIQRIIHKHGGRVWAEAELDKGASFFFTLGSSRDIGPEAHPGIGEVTIERNAHGDTSRRG